MYGLESARILVVEDHWHVADALRGLLEDIDADVIGPVATVGAVERVVAAQRPDLAVVDINLRGEMAYALIDHRKEQANGSAISSPPHCGP